MAENQMITSQELDELNQTYETAHPTEILQWAAENFWPNIAASSSFQTQGLPLLHMLHQVAPEMPIIFIDTGYHFPQTLAFRDRMVHEWGLNLQIARATLTKTQLQQQYGSEPYRLNPDMCCYVNKVLPMKEAMRGLTAWISGIRRDQSLSRSKTRVLEVTADGVLRIHPMANWSEREVWQYIHEHNLPEHPLLAEGFMSIGCAPCTRPVFDGEDSRSGRWAGQAKTECGLHTVLRSSKT
jgi:phosphoadenosine phosphosulfate reductase